MLSGTVSGAGTRNAGRDAISLREGHDFTQEILGKCFTSFQEGTILDTEGKVKILFVAIEVQSDMSNFWLGH